MGEKQHGNGNEKTLSRWLNYSCLLVGKLFKKCILEQDSEQKYKVLVFALTVAVCSRSSQWGTGALRRGPKARWNAELALEVNPFLVKEELNQFLTKGQKEI